MSKHAKFQTVCAADLREKKRNSWNQIEILILHIFLVKIKREKKKGILVAFLSHV